MVETSCSIINLLANSVLVVTENLTDIMTVREAGIFHMKSEKLTVSQPVKKFPTFIETEGPLPHDQAVYPYPEPHQSSPRP